MSILLSTTSVSYSSFALATAIANLKILIHVYIGRKLEDLSETFQRQPSSMEIITIIAGITVAVAVFLFLGYRIRNLVQSLEREGGYLYEEVVGSRSDFSPFQDQVSVLAETSEQHVLPELSSSMDLDNSPLILLS